MDSIVNFSHTAGGAFSKIPIFLGTALELLIFTSGKRGGKVSTYV